MAAAVLSGSLVTGASTASASPGYTAPSGGAVISYGPADSDTPCGDIFTITRLSPSEVQVNISSWDVRATIGTGSGTVDAFSNRVFRGGYNISSYAGGQFNIPAAHGVYVTLTVKKDGYEFCSGDYYV